MMHTFVLMFVGMAIIMGVKQMRLRLAVIVHNLVTPRPPARKPPRPIPEPLVHREYCLGCGRLVKHGAMGWNGYRYECDGCAYRDAL
jgi:hypothetical protein